MRDSAAKLLAYNNITTYFKSLEKHINKESLSENEKKLINEINIALEFNPDLEEELLDTYLAPVTSTYCGMKIVFFRKGEKQRKKNDKQDYHTVSYSEAEWKLIRKAAASRGTLFNALRDKIVQYEVELIEGGKNTRKFFVHMPLDTDLMLYLEVFRIGTRWLVIPTASCPIIYKKDEADEKMQTRFKSLRIKVSELKNKGVFFEQGKFIIKSTGNDQ